MNPKEKKLQEIVISEEQAQQFAEELYYSCDLVNEIKKCIAENKDDYKRFLRTWRKNNP